MKSNCVNHDIQKCLEFLKINRNISFFLSNKRKGKCLPPSWNSRHPSNRKIAGLPSDSPTLQVEYNICESIVVIFYNKSMWSLLAVHLGNETIVFTPSPFQKTMILQKKLPLKQRLSPTTITVSKRDLTSITMSSCVRSNESVMLCHSLNVGVWSHIKILCGSLWLGGNCSKYNLRNLIALFEISLFGELTSL